MLNARVNGDCDGFGGLSAGFIFVKREVRAGQCGIPSGPKPESHLPLNPATHVKIARHLRLQRNFSMKIKQW